MICPVGEGGPLAALIGACRAAGVALPQVARPALGDPRGRLVTPAHRGPVCPEDRRAFPDPQWSASQSGALVQVQVRARGTVRVIARGRVQRGELHYTVMPGAYLHAEQSRCAAHTHAPAGEG